MEGNRLCIFPTMGQYDYYSQFVGLVAKQINKQVLLALHW
jgi:hypothetical protein